MPPDSALASRDRFNSATPPAQFYCLRVHCLLPCTTAALVQHRPTAPAATPPSCDASLCHRVTITATVTSFRNFCCRGNYNTTSLLEMLAKHLDAVNGKCNIWEEFASCFLELRTTMLSHYEDCISANIGGVANNVHCNRIPIIFTEGETSDTWRLRCRWWVSRHFGRSIYFSETQAGEWMLLQFKAACAIHLYGPKFQYVTAVLSSLTQQGNASQLSYIHSHITNPMNLKEYLTNKLATVSNRDMFLH